MKKKENFLLQEVNDIIENKNSKNEENLSLNKTYPNNQLFIKSNQTEVVVGIYSKNSSFSQLKKKIKEFLTSRIFSILIFLKIKFSLKTIFPSIILSHFLNEYLYFNSTIYNDYNHSIRIISAIIFIIIGLKFILDNTRFSIKESFCITQDNNYEKTNENYLENGTETKYNYNNINNVSLTEDKDEDNEKSFIFRYKTNDKENKNICGVSINQILIVFENFLFINVVLLFSFILDRKNLFWNPNNLFQFLVPKYFNYVNNQKEVNFSKKDFLYDIIYCLTGFIVIITISKFCKKYFGKRKIVFMFGFFILFYFGIYSLYLAVLNKKTYHMRKIMLSNYTEKNNPILFLKKKDLELHFIINNSKFVKKGVDINKKKNVNKKTITLNLKKN